MVPSRPDRPWLGLDLDELTLAGEPVTVSAQVLGADPGSPSGVWASVAPADPPSTGTPHRMEYADGWWRADVPVAGPGVYRMTVEAVGVPRVDRVACSDVVGVLKG